MNALLVVSEWPKFSDGGKYLCVIREKNDKRQHGFIIGGSWDVNLGYVWDGGTGQFIQYDSSEAVFADGWRVD